VTDLPIVRIATRDDEEEIVEACHRLHKENGLFPLSVRKLLHVLEKAFEQNGSIVGVIGSPIEACIYMQLSSMWYSDNEIWEELWSFVLPEYRQSGNAKSLLKFATKISDDTGFPLLIGIVSNDRTQPKVRLYRRTFGEPAGAFFLHRPGH